MTAPRWEGDERGEGVADGRAFAPAVDELAAALRRPNWVAEEPEVHLLPHLERACESLPFELVSAQRTVDGVFDVTVRWTGGASVGAVREAVFALIGSFAESATAIRQRRDGGLVFEVATGMLDDAEFAPHGHTLRFTVT